MKEIKQKGFTKINIREERDGLLLEQDTDTIAINPASIPAVCAALMGCDEAVLRFHKCKYAGCNNPVPSMFNFCHEHYYSKGPEIDDLLHTIAGLSIDLNILKQQLTAIPPDGQREMNEGIFTKKDWDEFVAETVGSFRKSAPEKEPGINEQSIRDAIGADKPEPENLKWDAIFDKIFGPVVGERNGQKIRRRSPEPDKPEPAFAEPEWEFEWCNKGETELGHYKIIDFNDRFEIRKANSCATAGYLVISFDQIEKGMFDMFLPFISARLRYRKEWRQG